jgi:hypothetical protein
VTAHRWPTGASPTARGQALALLDQGWQRVESWLCAGVLVAEVISLTLWISLKGLSTDYTPGGNAAGLAYRCILTAALIGSVAHASARRGGAAIHRIAVLVAMALGLALGRSWVHAGVGWSSNVLNWLQNASALMLIGGLRGLATRLTLWLALLGASLAASRGTHIHVDVLTRYLPARQRAAAAMVGWLAAAAVCAAAVVGFVDYISIAEFRARAVQPCPGEESRSCDTPAAVKAGTVRRAISADLFLLGRQASLDGMSAPRVLAGRPYQWMTATEWNAWLDGADWTAHYGRAADALRMDPAAPDAVRMPQVAVPGSGEEARGLLIRELDLVFPFGLGVLAAKFLLRALLVWAGRLDPRAEDVP